MKKRVLAVLMAVLMAALCCSAGFAEEDTQPDRSFGFSGTYNSHTYNFNPTGGSQTYLLSSATYEVNDYLELTYTVVFGTYSTTGGNLILFNGGASYSFAYGPHYDTDIIASYTVTQGAVAANISQQLPSGYKYVSCRYKLKIQGDTVCNKFYTYMS